MREAENARQNRAEIVRALSTGQVSRRELFKWGIFTAGGALALTNGLSPFAPSKVYADVPTGTPPSPLGNARPFTQKMPRLALQTPITLTRKAPRYDPLSGRNEIDLAFPGNLGEPDARRMSWHTDFDASNRTQYKNPLTGAGPMEGRPPGEWFAQQRWEEYLPQVAYVMRLASLSGFRFHRDLPVQGPNKLWTFGAGRTAAGGLPPLIKVRYGEPVIFRHYNGLPLDRTENGGFGSNSQATHNHNGHNASTGDGASNAHFFPGQFYDYHWTTTLARADMPTPNVPNVPNPARLASGPDGRGGLNLVPGDYRELQSSLWFHDHRFFYTADNVYKGHAGVLNYYSGKDRGNETINDGVNLRLPSGSQLDWGNIDFDVNLMIHDAAWDQDGQYFFDIFDTDGFLGDQVMVNFAYKPYFEVLPRKYRFRILAASMARFWKLGLLNPSNQFVSMKVIATDGNLLPAPVSVNQLDIQGPAERFDVVIDFSRFPLGSKLRMVNRVKHDDGKGPKGLVSLRDALRGNSDDPAVGAFLEFRVVGELQSVDRPSHTYRVAGQSQSDLDPSRVPLTLTQAIPIVAPARVRVIEFKSADLDETPRDPVTGECFPDCPSYRAEFPWGARINGEDTHTLNGNRVSMLVPGPGEVEHWVLRNPSGGWDHPVHLHFEEGRTIDRGGRTLTALERNSRKDVWRLGEGGEVRIQVRFGEFGGAYVTHCHNTVHEDAAMLVRYDVLTNGGTHHQIVPTPNPTPQGVTYVTPEVLPEGNPFHPDFEPFPSEA